MLKRFGSVMNAMAIADINQIRDVSTIAARKKPTT
jgi:hypothetical protein